LNAAKINSIVNADKDDYWFSSEHKRTEKCEWIVILVPAKMGFQNEQFFYENQFDRMASVFQKLIFFFQDENRYNWSLKIKVNNAVVEKEFDSDDTTEFTDVEETLFSDCFDKNFDQMKPFLKAGKAMEFLNSSGIPYHEIYDQDLFNESYFSEKHSLLFDDIRD
jgi:hypothetical protein